MLNDLAKIEKSAREEIKRAETFDALEKLRVQFLGRKGALSLMLRAMKDVPQKDRAEIGSFANRLRFELEKLFAEREGELKKLRHESVLEDEWIDVSRPAVKIPRGHLHPLTLVRREVEEIFGSMGFAVVEGPEAESEHYNFDALNIPAEHPSRDMWDTFWLRSNQKIPNSKFQIPNKTPNSKSQTRLLLRTHTSPVQVRFMEKHEPPFRIIVPGRVFRYEATDASHEIQFYQAEGLMVDRHVSIANFKFVIQEFLRQLFKTKDLQIRLRPSYFPFVEPGFEIDMSCTACKKSKIKNQKSKMLCSVCKDTGWLEMMGAGMVHQNVFRAAGYIPGEWTGFAFGIGLDRVAMMKYNIPDIRLLHSGDVRFLKQF